MNRYQYLSVLPGRDRLILRKPNTLVSAVILGMLSM